MQYRCALTRWWILLLATAGGCAISPQYGFDIVQPAQIAQYTTPDHAAVADLAPLQYQFRAVEGKLVIDIQNPTDSAIILDGDVSYAVSPDLQSHPLYTQSIAPGTYIRLILPPAPPVIQLEGPIYYGHPVPGPYHGRFGRYPYYGHRTFHYRRYDDPNTRFTWYGPYSYTVDVTGDPHYWEWTDEDDVRLSLTYRRSDGKTFTHGFLFRRVKLK